MKVRFKKEVSTAPLPSYAKPGDAGLDLVAVSIKENTTFQVTYGLGISCEIPSGYVGLIYPRSSIRKYELVLSNSVGVVDSGYRGELQATFNKTNGLLSMMYRIGERVCQMVIVPYPMIEVEEAADLEPSERGEGGFGSTGR